jgi:hypothetical protein
MQQGGHHGAGVAAAATAVVPDIEMDKPFDENHTVIAMCVDRSGSMSAMGAEVEGGCNAYLDEQRKADEENGKKSRTTVILNTFDSSVETVLPACDLTRVSPITHEQVAPRGMTALYDGIGETIRQTAELVNFLPARPSVVVFILTDGKENSSHTWTKSRVTEAITLLSNEVYDWNFYFAAANQDAMSEGQKIGLEREKCMKWGFEGTKMKSAMQSANVAYQRKKKGVSRGGFNDYERNQCE